MEASDPFAAAAPDGVTNDPFADVEAMEPVAPAADDIPIVDREGARVEPAAAPDATDPAAPQAAVVDEAEQPVAPAAQPEATPPPAPAPAPAEAPQEPQEAPAPPAAPAEAPAPAAPQETAEEGAAREAQEAAQAAALAEAEAAGTVEEVPAPAAPAETPPAAPAAETPPASNGATAGPRGGKGEMRHYKALYQTAENVWTEFKLTGEMPEGVKVVTIDGEPYFEARNNDHATRIAFALLGQPAEGATVWPVPKGAFKPKRVKPAAPRPERTRLEIS